MNKDIIFLIVSACYGLLIVFMAVRVNRIVRSKGGDLSSWSGFIAATTIRILGAGTFVVFILVYQQKIQLSKKIIVGGVGIELIIVLVGMILDVYFSTKVNEDQNT